MSKSTFNPRLHVGYARWTRSGPGSPELVYVVATEHSFGDGRQGTVATIRRADGTRRDDIPGTALSNVDGGR